MCVEPLKIKYELTLTPADVARTDKLRRRRPLTIGYVSAAKAANS